MPRDGAITFSDLIGKLDVLRVECAKYPLVPAGRTRSKQLPIGVLERTDLPPPP
jgi:hypothetical protein